MLRPTPVTVTENLAWELSHSDGVGAEKFVVWLGVCGVGTLRPLHVFPTISTTYISLSANFAAKILLKQKSEEQSLESTALDKMRLLSVRWI